MSAQFRTHVVEVNAVMAWLRWADVSITGKEGAGAQSIGCVIAFWQGKEELVPFVFNTWKLVAVD